MIVDKPLSVVDFLSDADSARHIAEVLKPIVTLTQDNEKGSISVAVSGDWGSGKTSHLRVIESFFRDYHGFPVVFFDAWKHQDDDNPLASLLLEIKDIPHINYRLRSWFPDLLKTLKVALLASSDFFLKLWKAPGLDTIEKAFSIVEKGELELASRYRNNLSRFEKTISEIRDTYSYAGNAPDSERIKNVWEERVSGGLPRIQNKRLFVLLIDDLDRLVPEKAFKIIEMLRFYFDVDNVLIIMGINDEALDSFVNERFGVARSSAGDQKKTGEKDEKRPEQKKKGEKFLEKIFHWNYELDYSGINEQHLRCLRSMLDEPGLDRARHVLNSIDRLAHRKWIKLVNRIEKKIMAGASASDIESIIFAAALKELYPNFEFFSRRFPNVLESLRAGGELKDFITSEALAIIKTDKGYLDFPERNFTALKNAASMRAQEAADI